MAECAVPPRDQVRWHADAARRAPAINVQEVPLILQKPADDAIVDPVAGVASRQVPERNKQRHSRRDKPRDRCADVTESTPGPGYRPVSHYPRPHQIGHSASRVADLMVMFPIQTWSWLLSGAKGSWALIKGCAVALTWCMDVMAEFSHALAKSRAIEASDRAPRALTALEPAHPQQRALMTR